MLDNNPDIGRNETLGQFITSHGYSELFQQAYLVRTLKTTLLCYSPILDYYDHPNDFGINCIL